MDSLVGDARRITGWNIIWIRRVKG